MSHTQFCAHRKIFRRPRFQERRVSFIRDPKKTNSIVLGSQETFHPFTMTQYNAFAGTPIALSAVFLPLASISVALRIFARSRTKANVGFDDLLAFLALVVYFGFSAIILYGTSSRVNEISFSAE